MNIVEGFFSLMQAGTWWIMWPIFAIGIVIWFLGLERIAVLSAERRARAAFLEGLTKNTAGGSTGSRNYDRLAADLEKRRGASSEARRAIYQEFLVFMIPELEAGFATMSAWIYVSPLMGLLGTVIGMIETFKSIMIFGTNNPGFMARGISVALLTTQAGLIVAFPGLVLQVLLLNQKNALVELLEHDSERAVAG